MPKRRPVVSVSGLPLRFHPAWTNILKFQVALIVLTTTVDTFDAAMIKDFAWRVLVIGTLLFFRFQPSLKLVLLYLLHQAVAETVYDCAAANTAVATYSPGEIGECPDFKHQYRNVTHMKAQIVQRAGHQLVDGYQCQLTLERVACYCGDLHHQYGCKPIEFTQDRHLTAEECWKVVRTGIYENLWFNLTEVRTDHPFKYSYYSKGRYNTDGTCEAKHFERNGREFESHYERTDVTLRVTSHSFQTTTGILSKKGFDILLPHQVRMPAAKAFYVDNRHADLRNQLYLLELFNTHYITIILVVLWAAMSLALILESERVNSSSF